MRVVYRFLTLILLATAMSSMMPPARAQAATATATIAVSATILAFCTISATTLPFGNYSSTVLNVNATVTVACTSGTTYNVGLDVGTGTGATVAARKMMMSTNSLTYSLYQDTGHSTVWGPTIGTNTETGTGNGASQPLTVYGQIPASQLSAPGNYTDSVIATITY